MAGLVTAMVVRPLVSTVLQKASSSLLDQYKVMEGMEERHEKLRLLLPAILDVINDAEKQATRRGGVEPWLRKLKMVAYESIEVFDEFKYEALRRQARKEGHYIKLGMDVIKLFPTHNRIMFRYRMGNKLCKIVRDIEALVKQMNDFWFNKESQVQRPTHSLREDSSFIQDPDCIVSRSREEERQKIVKILVNDHAKNKDLMVIPIVGMGGLGKTTLAQLIFNDPQVQTHFQLMKWVTVSDDFDVCNLASKICDLAVENNLEKALQNLKKIISGKRYLLVLDDVWNEDVDKWEKLKACLEHGNAGSAVLVTTRGKSVAQLMSTGIDHDIAVLDKKFIKEIIERRAFRMEMGKPVELVDLVDEIANKCFGSPLAAKALGGVLRNKTTLQEWKAISEGSNICTDDTGILPILNLSYDALPADMKQCFAFCAIFPKDYEIDVEMLIQLWMANGFIAEQEKPCTEVIGKRMFNEMVSRSFFQDVKEVRVNEYGRMGSYSSRIICKIHDLMHDIALSVMERECVAITNRSNSISELFSNAARHLHFTSYRAWTMFNRSMNNISPAIQTLLCDRLLGVGLQDSPKYSSLRALKLYVYHFPMRSKHLHHLRYLNLSGSYIQALPEDISILYNLQTLNLSGCGLLKRLPKQMRYMTALRHLYINGCSQLEFMPPELGRLTFLQTLTNFVAGIGSDCSNLGELRHLNIGSSLVLTQLENVTEEDAKMANLGDKKDLRELSLIWKSSETDELNSYKVLEGLKSPYGLEALRIDSYQGATFPTWMSMLQNMVELYLYDCKKCEKLPSLCHVPTLQVLCLDGLETLQCLYSVVDTSLTFSKLKVLKLSNLQNFESWGETNWEYKGQIIFPDLEKLTISWCPKLIALPDAMVAIEPCSTEDSSMTQTTFPGLEAVMETQERLVIFPLPQLQESSIQECPEPAVTLLGASLGHENKRRQSAFPELKELEFNGLKSFKSWGTYDERPSFCKLERADVIDCPQLRTLPEAPNLSALKIHGANPQIYLEVHRFLNLLSKLDLSVEEIETNFPSEHNTFELMAKCNHESPLEVMELHRCSLFFWSSALVPRATFVQIQQLKISECNMLVYWPEKEFQRLVSLRRLRINDCQNLIGHAQAPDDQLTSERMQLLPHLESLEIDRCLSLEEFFNLPPSLKRMQVFSCSKLQRIFGKQQDRPTALNQGPSTDIVAFTAVQEQSSLATDHFLPCLEYLHIEECDGLTEVRNLPPSLTGLSIAFCYNIQFLSARLDALQHLSFWRCDSLRSLDLGDLLALECLSVVECKSLASLPNGPQAYSSLRELTITYCPGIKSFPSSLQRRLPSLEDKNLDARYEARFTCFGGK